MERNTDLCNTNSSRRSQITALGANAGQYITNCRFHDARGRCNAYGKRCFACGQFNHLPRSRMCKDNQGQLVGYKNEDTVVSHTNQVSATNANVPGARSSEMSLSNEMLFL